MQSPITATTLANRLIETVEKISEAKINAANSFFNIAIESLREGQEKSAVALSLDTVRQAQEIHIEEGQKWDAGDKLAFIFTSLKHVLQGALVQSEGEVPETLARAVAIANLLNDGRNAGEFTLDTEDAVRDAKIWQALKVALFEVAYPRRSKIKPEPEKADQRCDCPDCTCKRGLN